MLVKPATEKRQLCLYVYTGYYVFTATHIHARSHSQRGVMLIFDLGGSGFTLRPGTTGRLPAAVVRQDWVHEFEGGAGPQLFVMIDPDLPAARALSARYLRAGPFMALPLLESSRSTVTVIADRVGQHEGCERVRMAVEQLVQVLAGEALAPPLEPDPRVLAVCTTLRNDINRARRVPELAAGLKLSESRLQHLFKAEMGYPITSFIKWLRINRALTAIAAGESLSGAAFAADFSDAAHFARTFKQMFGITPGNVFGPDSSVNIRVCSQP